MKNTHRSLRFVFPCIYLFSLLIPSGIFSNHFFAQGTYNKDSIRNLWPLIEVQLHDKTDTSFQFISLLVKAQCGQDAACQYQTYNFLADKFVEFRNPEAGIYVSKEMMKMAREMEDPDAEGRASYRLSRFYDYLDYAPLSARALEDAIELFEQTGNRKELLKIKSLKLNQNIHNLDDSQMIAAYHALLAEARALKDTTTIYSVLDGLYRKNYSVEKFDAASATLDELESILPQNPVPFKTYWIYIAYYCSRAELALVQKNYDQAKAHYLEAFKYAREEPSPWYESAVMLSLFNIEKQHGNPQEAVYFLNQAYQKALEFNLDNLLYPIYTAKMEIAESEGNYAEALEFKKKEIHHRDKYNNRSDGFNLQNFYLEIDKEKLATEKASKEAELNFKNSQARTYLIILVLSLLLVTGLVSAYILLRNSKTALAGQHRLIQQQAAALQNLDAAKSRFFANVSHELRTPISLIHAPIDTLLKENNLTAKQTKLLQMASRSGDQLRMLVTDLLDLSKLEAGKIIMEEKPTRLRPFFRRYFLQFESLAIRNQLDFSVETALDEETVAILDQHKCRQIINNLLSNAFKFTPPGGKVRAGVTLEGNYLHLKVSDTGTGIHPDDLPYVFDRYFQTNLVNKPAEGGTGIGLALCHEYAQLFGGKIEVQSTLGEGTVFIMQFPVKLLEQSERDALPSDMPERVISGYHSETENTSTLPGEGVNNTSQPPTSTKPVILIVEDNHELQDYLQLVLQEKYQILTAGNGKMALELLGKAEQKRKEAPDSTSSAFMPDLILSDLMMPVMDGYQLLEKLKSRDATRHIPVVMLTARADVRDKLKALRLGVDDYLLKPFEEEELLVRIENLLKNQAGRREFIAENQEIDKPETLSEADQAWLESFENYLNRHLSDDTLNIPALAQEFAMSESTLLRQLKRLTGLSPVKYLQELRLAEARRLLEDSPQYSISLIASKVGYTDARNFSRSFKSRFGKLPSAFS